MIAVDPLLASTDDARKEEAASGKGGRLPA
jgi:hypothetical protein